MEGESDGYKLRERRITPARKPFELTERLRRMVERGKAATAEPFQGITTKGSVIADLFPIRRTGVSLQPVVDAAVAFLGALYPEQRALVRFDIGSEAWRSWNNIHPYLTRHGICLEELSPDQRASALALVRASMSAGGFEAACNVMKLNQYLRALTGRSEEFGEWFYWLSVMGSPSEAEPWGWQIDGHHLIINCFALGDQLVLTPNFMGSEPVLARSGPYAGTRVFATEERQGFALMNSLTPEQQKKATIGAALPPEVVAGAYLDNLQLAYAGIRHDELSPEQRILLCGLIETYVGRMRPGHAEIKIAEVQQHLAETHFAWIGGYDAQSPFYYRIHSPVILIEFDHEPGIALANDQPSRDHIHTLIRTPNGNDYGKDLLRQHYARFDHSHPLTPHRLGKA